MARGSPSSPSSRGALEEHEEVCLDVDEHTHTEKKGRNVQQPGPDRAGAGLGIPSRTLISDLQRMGQRLPQHGHMLH